MKKLSYFLFGALLIAYILFQARFLIIGPRITVDTPKDNSVVDAGVVAVAGGAENVSTLTLDDRPIYTDTQGRWQDKLIAPQGITIIKLIARDRFGRETEKMIRIVAK